LSPSGTERARHSRHAPAAGSRTATRGPPPSPFVLLDCPHGHSERIRARHPRRRTHPRRPLGRRVGGWPHRRCPPHPAGGPARPLRRAALRRRRLRRLPHRRPLAPGRRVAQRERLRRDRRHRRHGVLEPGQRQADRRRGRRRAVGDVTRMTPTHRLLAAPAAAAAALLLLSACTPGSEPEPQDSSAAAEPATTASATAEAGDEYPAAVSRDLDLDFGATTYDRFPACHHDGPVTVQGGRSVFTPSDPTDEMGDAEVELTITGAPTFLE